MCAALLRVAFPASVLQKDYRMTFVGHRSIAQEMLTALLMQAVANLGATEADKDDQPETCDITVADILGPLLLDEVDTRAEAAACSRDARFSLLSYSFSLVGRAPAATSNSAPLMGPAAKQGCSRVTHTAYMWRMLELYNADGRFVALAMSPPYVNAPPTCRVQNPALRHELSFEMGQMHSDMALYFDDKVEVGPPGTSGSKVPKSYIKSRS